MQDLRSILHQFPYGAPIQNVTGQSFFQDFDIRKVLSFDWKRLIDKGLIPEEYACFVQGFNPFFVFPLCLSSSYTFDDLMGLDETLQPIVEKGRMLSFPPNFQSVHNTYSVVVCGSMEDFIEAHRTKLERKFPLGSALIILDSLVNTFEKNKLDTWLPILKTKEVYAYKGKYHLQVKERLAYLGVEHSDSTEPQSKAAPARKMPAPANKEITYLNKEEVVKHLNEKGIPATIDTVRKISKIVKIPFTKLSDRGYELFDPDFFVLFYANRKKGLPRKEAAEKAIRDFRR